MASEVDVECSPRPSSSSSVSSQPTSPSKDLFRLPDHRMACQDSNARARPSAGCAMPRPSWPAPIEKYRDTLPKLQSGLEDYAEKTQEPRHGQRRGPAHPGDQAMPGTRPQTHTRSGGLRKVPLLRGSRSGQDEGRPGPARVPATSASEGSCGFHGQGARRLRRSTQPLWTRKPRSIPSRSHVEDYPQAVLRGGRTPSSRPWESCGKRSRKGKKKEICESVLLTVNDYMAARTGVASAAPGILAQEASRFAGDRRVAPFSSTTAAHPLNACRRGGRLPGPSRVSS